ncbi:TetR-like C-terminal domain-containing protein [Niallia sp. Man26]|uniref:TetR/AcrR family transcriptional regulator n=1 Tax=Niallia sp. Man26 TaxID=2912824 RepID=UPI001EDB651E|nr:TetR-like C-terminal domain-containing protein [Niallia sp. Man26]UPO90141.1 TetR family transcriptional regulator C-terminal domain-containing protein [Niallia sp. Man26]
MTKVDRRIIKSKKAIKKALIDLMSENSFDQITVQNIVDQADISRKTFYLHYLDKFDLIDKLIEEHIHELREICDSASEENEVVSWFEYFRDNYLFFSMMLNSKGAPFFRKRFLEFVIEDIKNGWDITLDGKNLGLSEDVILQFFGAAYVQVVEWWFTNEMPYPPQVMEKQIEILLERNLE